ncbi:uncharacterized protein LOC132066244 [Lycium ferocissimum]|uniref:uncharacterized protein LOC132066244 n=1 Tax=Lycium ferocissimum TaxID=112874 RepID=UPI00281521CE|nr:uncharacterized protein LOC132066244 [Lycium ferocissimum]
MKVRAESPLRLPLIAHTPPILGEQEGVSTPAPAPPVPPPDALSQEMRQFPRLRFDRPTYLRSGQGSRVLNSQYRGEFSQMRPPASQCPQCRRLHAGPCRLGSDVCYACAWPGHFMRECPFRYGRGRVQPTGIAVGSSSLVRLPRQRLQISAGCDRDRGGTPSSSGPQHHTYVLARRQDLESSPDIVPGILLAFFYNVYASIDSVSTSSYIAPYIVERIGLKPELNQTI